MSVFFAQFSRVLIACLLPLSVVSTWAKFTDVTSSSGIANVHSARNDGVNNHAGGAAVDVNGDGLTDLLLAKFGAAPLLYINKGNGQFVDEAGARGLSGALDAAGFGAGDFDNDGDVDIYMTVHEGPRFYLYINDGDGNFTEDAVARGAALSVTAFPHQGYSVGLVDFDLDGFLDISISEWGVEISDENPLHSALLRNLGGESAGSFEVVTSEAGLVQPTGRDEQSGFSSGWADFDEDGWPDLAMVADYKQSKMYWNDGDGTFTQSGSSSGVGFDDNGAGVAVADYDGDGLLDFYVTSIFDRFSFDKNGTPTGNKLYKNTGGRNFQEVSVPAGVSRTGWGWGAAFLELDNDGDFDLVATNGMNVSEGEDRDTTPWVDAASDATTLFANAGDGTFSNGTAASGISDDRYGKAVIVLDYDNDGDEDLVIVNSFSDPIVYESDAAENGNDWIRFTFEGTVSNRDAIGTLVKVTEGGKTQTLVYNPSNAYIGQREAALHFGLGDSDGVVDSVEIKWPTGLSQTITDLAANPAQSHHLVEPVDAPTPPIFSMQPVVTGAFEFGDELLLEVNAIGSPAPTFVWEKNGEAIEGVSGNSLRIKRLAPFDVGTYRAKANSSGGETLSDSVVVEVNIDLNKHSVARWWNEFMMEAIRRDFPDPTKHSRNLYHVSAVMWDAFWPYEEEQWTMAAPVFHKEAVDSASWGADRLGAQREAISHAAFTVLSYRYLKSPGAEASEFGFRWLMEQFGYDPDFTSVVGDSPAAVGNRIGHAVLDLNFSDGSNERNNYADTSHYVAINPELPVELFGTSVVDINRWQPLAFDFAISQNGIPIGALVQTFIGVNWREVATFAMKKPTSNTIAFDPGAPPQFDGASRGEFVDSVVEVIRYSSYLDPVDDEMIDISPGFRLNNPIGTNDGMGRPMNPVTGNPYESNRVKRADYGRILAEFWADGPASETPPGHWNTLHNEVTEHPLFERRYMGVGSELSALEWDVRAYVALNGGMHDSAVAAWTLKRQYDYSRPITMIREMGGNGQSSDPSLPDYHPDGLPLISGLIELVTFESSDEGERHEAFEFDVGKVVIRAWAGEPENAHTDVGGVEWIFPEDWLPYQRSTFVTPAFAAYVSGHSTFSRSGAEVMTLLTGSPYFPGGMGEFRFPKSEFLEFEKGPSDDVTLQWATYYDAADQAGISRLYGGIHVRADDFVGRILGARLGVEAFVKAHSLRNANDAPGMLAGVTVNQNVVAGADAALAQFDVEGDLLPVRFASSVAEAEAGIDAAIYFVIPDSNEFGASSEIQIVSNSGLVQGVAVGGQISESESLVIDVVLNSEEPVILLVTGQGSSLEGGADRILLKESSMSLDGQGVVELQANDGWRNHETASLSEALILRGNNGMTLEETETALPLVLVPGSYRFTLRSVGEGGVARLSVSGQNWR